MRIDVWESRCGAGAGPLTGAVTAAMVMVFFSARGGAEVRGGGSGEP
jgi:hypothetical protein